MGPMTQTRFLILFLVATMIVGLAPKAAGFEGEGNPTPPSCVHESVYEPFAGLILVSVTIAGSPPLDFVVDTGATSSA